MSNTTTTTGAYRAAINNLKNSSLDNLKATLAVETRMLARGCSDSRYVEVLQMAIAELETEKAA